MNPNRRTLLAAGALAALGVRTTAALAQPQPAAGRNYSVLNPVLPVENPAKVEVIEFFWYGCIHCYNFEPALEKWLAKVPADVEFRRVPAIFNERWLHDAVIYYALEALGVIGKTHQPLFDAIHQLRLDTARKEPFNAWLAKTGVDVKKFEEAYKSFGVQSKALRARQLTGSYRIDGTPALAVHGTYTVSADQGGTQNGMLAVADHLIGLARKNLGVRR